MRIFTLGHYYDLEFNGRLVDHGTCDDTKKPYKKIRIRKSLRGRQLIDTLCHEITHAAVPWLRESVVRSFATDFGAEMTRKWRRTHRLLGGSDSDALECLISRLFHVHFPFIEDSWITEFSMQLAKVYHRLGWRKTNAT